MQVCYLSIIADILAAVVVPGRLYVVPRCTYVASRRTVLDIRDMCVSADADSIRRMDVSTHMIYVEGPVTLLHLVVTQNVLFEDVVHLSEYDTGATLSLDRTGDAWAVSTRKVVV